eukprot:395570-Pelagomonas_calceolata.AAC.1
MTHSLRKGCMYWMRDDVVRHLPVDEVRNLRPDEPDQPLRKVWNVLTEQEHTCSVCKHMAICSPTGSGKTFAFKPRIVSTCHEECWPFQT